MTTAAQPATLGIRTVEDLLATAVGEVKCRLAPAVGLEPTTRGLTVRCSTN